MIEEIIDVVRFLIEDDPNDSYMTYQQIECSLEISSTTSTYSTAHDHLKLQLVCIPWVSHQFTNDQNVCEFSSTKSLWKDLRKDDLGTFFDSTTGNESWFYHKQNPKM